MVICTNCQISNSDDSVFCYNCGTVISNSHSKSNPSLNSSHSPNIISHLTPSSQISNFTGSANTLNGSSSPRFLNSKDLFITIISVIFDLSIFIILKPDLQFLDSLGSVFILFFCGCSAYFMIYFEFDHNNIGRLFGLSLFYFLLFYSLLYFNILGFFISLIQIYIKGYNLFYLHKFEIFNQLSVSGNHG